MMPTERSLAAAPAILMGYALVAGAISAAVFAYAMGRCAAGRGGEMPPAQPLTLVLAAASALAFEFFVILGFWAARSWARQADDQDKTGSTCHETA